jgi:uncharacterized membrane protein HdeD (DUF308 family)
VIRERALKVVLVLVGLLFLAGIYPLATSLWHPSPSDDKGDMMMLSLYVTLGVLLLIAVRNPSEHRSLIAFAAWSSFAHGTVMVILGLQYASDRKGSLIAAAVLALIGAIFIVLAPVKASTERVSPAGARLEPTT